MTRLLPNSNTRHCEQTGGVDSQVCSRPSQAVGTYSARDTGFGSGDNTDLNSLQSVRGREDSERRKNTREERTRMRMSVGSTTDRLEHQQADGGEGASSARTPAFHNAEKSRGDKGATESTCVSSVQSNRDPSPSQTSIRSNAFTFDSRPISIFLDSQLICNCCSCYMKTHQESHLQRVDRRGVEV